MVARAVALALALSLACSTGGRAYTLPPAWSSAGATLQDSRSQLSPVGPTQLNAETAANLKLRWSFATTGDVSTTPTVEPGGLYFPDWGGMLYKLSPATGAVIWSRRVSSYTGDPNSVSRSSPAIVGNMIIIGDLSIARVIAINKTTGDLIWKTQVDTNDDAYASTSATVYNNIVYFGIASREETLEHPPTGGFRGSVVALNLQTGALLWKFTTVPAGYTGGGVVSAPVVDPIQNSVYIASDNNYSVPATVETCIKAAIKAAATNMTAQLACMAANNYVDAILSLDLNSGALKWSRRFSGADTWTAACNEAGGCPQAPGNDFDFAASPNVFPVAGFVGEPDDRGGTANKWILGIGQKNGIYRAINPVNGGVFWSTLVGLGGIQWGTAADTDNYRHVYVAVKNDAHRTNTITDYYGNTRQWAAGSWAQLDATTGKIIWQIPAYGNDLKTPQVGAAAPGAVSFTNNVVFAGGTSGYMTALDATTGSILWTFQSHGSIYSGPAIFDDRVYWGTGYARLGGVGFHMLYAFSLD